MKKKQTVLLCKPEGGQEVFQRKPHYQNGHKTEVLYCRVFDWNETAIHTPGCKSFLHCIGQSKLDLVNLLDHPCYGSKISEIVTEGIEAKKSITVKEKLNSTWSSRGI
jgi:hypothetical protein